MSGAGSEPEDEDQGFEARVRLIAEEVFGKRFSMIKSGGSGNIQRFEVRVTVPNNDPGGWKSGKGKRSKKRKTGDF